MKDLEFLKEEYKKDPSKFEQETIYETPEFLKKFGIVIPNKENFPFGYIKFFPQDFLVEEISQTGEIYTIDKPTEKQQANVTGEGETFYATLVKCNYSTLEAINDIVKQLGCDPQQVGFAGIKDKNAITAQRISFRKVPLSDIENINSPYYFLKDIEQGKGIIKKGDLLGNKFTIFVRTTENIHDVSQKEQNFLQNVQDIYDHGFYNFYYLQRFGAPRLSNYQWAYLILKGKYELAVKNILTKESEGDIQYITDIRKKLIWPNFKEMYEILSKTPSLFSSELRIVEHLKDNPTDFKGALSAVSEQTTMWIYALSSWLYNFKLSTFSKFKKKPPHLMPLFLSYDKKDQQFYKKILEQNKIYPPPFENLKDFPFIRLNKRDVKTTASADVSRCEIFDNGIVISFTLEKGEYATTFLSHLFNLMSGKPPKEIDETPIDSKKILEEGEVSETESYFSSVITSANDNMYQ